jgi:hypothetical protein
VLIIGKQQPIDGPVYSLGCIGQENLEFLRLQVDISSEDELLFLIDTGATVSLLKGNKVVGSTEYDPEKKVKVKCVVGSPVEANGVVQAKIECSDCLIMHEFQLVSKQVDTPCDGIVGCDFVQHIRAEVHYEMWTVELNGEVYKMVGKAKQLEAKEAYVRKTEQSKLSL